MVIERNYQANSSAFYTDTDKKSLGKKGERANKTIAGQADQENRIKARYKRNASAHMG